MAKQFTLGKHERLKSRKRIEQLFNEGKAFNTFPFRIYYAEGLPLTSIRPIEGTASITPCFGVTVGTKNFKKAVDRNRIKRLTREAWRLQSHKLKDTLTNRKKQLNIFFIYTAKELPEYNFVYEKTGAIINKLIKIINENNSPDS